MSCTRPLSSKDKWNIRGTILQSVVLRLLLVLALVVGGAVVLFGGEQNESRWPGVVALICGIAVGVYSYTIWWKSYRQMRRAAISENETGKMCVRNDNAYEQFKDSFIR